MNDFDRYRPMMLIVYAAMLIVPCGFGAVVLGGGSPVTPELYGSAVYKTPALIWVGGQVGFNLLTVVALVARRPRVAACGGFALAALLAYFAAGATTAGAMGSLVVFGSLSFAVISASLAITCWQGRENAGRRQPTA